MDGALFWKQQFGLNNSYVLSDHGPNGGQAQARWSMIPGNSVGTPQLSVIDPRTMAVTYLQEGWGGSELPQLVDLAALNFASRPQHPTIPPQQ